MEEEQWQKDTTPYIVFTCTKCRQYMYVKTTQKTKKCLRCGRSHKVSEISNSGEMVSGMTTALKIIKKRQQEFAIKELGLAPEFRTPSDFKVNQKSKHQKKLPKKIYDAYELKFHDMLMELTNIYTTFPLYIIEIWADKYSIPKDELKLLRRRFQKQGWLIRINNSTYKYCSQYSRMK